MDYLQSPEFRRKVSTAFKAQTRTGWSTAHESRTKPPCVGHYNPKFSRVDRNYQTATIHKTHENLGEAPLKEKAMAQTQVCFKSMRLMNYEPHNKQSLKVS